MITLWCSLWLSGKDHTHFTVFDFLDYLIFQGGILNLRVRVASAWFPGHPSHSTSLSAPGILGRPVKTAPLGRQSPALGNPARARNRVHGGCCCSLWPQLSLGLRTQTGWVQVPTRSLPGRLRSTIHSSAPSFLAVYRASEPHLPAEASLLTEMVPCLGFGGHTKGSSLKFQEPRNPGQYPVLLLSRLCERL